MTTKSYSPTIAQIAVDYNVQPHEVAASCLLGTDYADDAPLTDWQNRWMRGVMDILAEQKADQA